MSKPKSPPRPEVAVDTAVSNFEDDPEYQKFIEKCADECECCLFCNCDVPCDSIMAGGPCEHNCTCDEDEDDPFYDEDEEYC